MVGDDDSSTSVVRDTVTSKGTYVVGSAIGRSGQVVSFFVIPPRNERPRAPKRVVVRDWLHVTVQIAPLDRQFSGPMVCAG